MAMSVEFDAAARVEFDEAFNWCAERSPGAAIGFATEVDIAIESITAEGGPFSTDLCRLPALPLETISVLRGLLSPWNFPARCCRGARKTPSRLLAWSGMNCVDPRTHKDTHGCKRRKPRPSQSLSDSPCREKHSATRHTWRSLADIIWNIW